MGSVTAAMVFGILAIPAFAVVDKDLQEQFLGVDRGVSFTGMSESWASWFKSNPQTKPRVDFENRLKHTWHEQGPLGIQLRACTSREENVLKVSLRVSAVKNAGLPDWIRPGLALLSIGGKAA